MIPPILYRVGRPQVEAALSQYRGYPTIMHKAGLQLLHFIPRVSIYYKDSVKEFPDPE